MGIYGLQKYLLQNNLELKSNIDQYQIVSYFHAWPIQRKLNNIIVDFDNLFYTVKYENKNLLTIEEIGDHIMKHVFKVFMNQGIYICCVVGQDTQKKDLKYFTTIKKFFFNQQDHYIHTHLSNYNQQHKKQLTHEDIKRKDEWDLYHLYYRTKSTKNYRYTDLQKCATYMNEHHKVPMLFHEDTDLLCSILVKYGVFDAVYTKDTDMILYNVPLILYLKNGKIVTYSSERILKHFTQYFPTDTLKHFQIVSAICHHDQNPYFFRFDLDFRTILHMYLQKNTSIEATVKQICREKNYIYYEKMIYNLSMLFHIPLKYKQREYILHIIKQFPEKNIDIKLLFVYIKHHYRMKHLYQIFQEYHFILFLIKQGYFS